MLTVGTTAIVAAYPPSREVPMRLPPLPASPYGDVSAKELTVRGPGKVPFAPSYQMRYLSRSIQHVGPGESAVTMAICRGSMTTSISSCLEVLQSAALTGIDALHYRFAGGELCGELHLAGTTLKLNERGGLDHGSFTLNYSLPSVDDPLTEPHRRKTMSFIAALVQGGELKINLDDRPVMSTRVLVPEMNHVDLAIVEEALGLQRGPVT